MEDDWDEVTDKLFDDFDFRFIRHDNFTRILSGKEAAALETTIDIDASEYRPFRWWERQVTASV